MREMGTVFISLNQVHNTNIKVKKKEQEKIKDVNRAFKTTKSIRLYLIIFFRKLVAVVVKCTNGMKYCCEDGDDSKGYN